MEILSAICAILALTGAWLNASQKKEGFYFWIVTNMYFCLQSASAELYSQSALFGIYFALAIKGLISWKK